MGVLYICYKNVTNHKDNGTLASIYLEYGIVTQLTPQPVALDVSRQ